MQLAREERALARRSEDRALHEMIKNLARPDYGTTLFAVIRESPTLHQTAA
jgi:hypothetical protein